jgi:dihydropteroate synthase
MPGAESENPSLPMAREAAAITIGGGAMTGSASANIMQWGKRTLDFNKRPLLMGILNATPDSFYPGSRISTVQSALEYAGEMIAAGVDIIDIGGESTRPGSDPVSAETEMRRVVPLILELKNHFDIPLSIDTMKFAVARAGIEAGAEMVNAVSGLKNDVELAGLIAEKDLPVVLMHMRGEPKTMQTNPGFNDTMAEIVGELEVLARQAMSCGIKSSRIILDPGIGFGKRLNDNLLIIKHLKRIKELGFPVLIGISRKSFIGLILDRPVEERLIGTVTANTIAALNGADIVRVHDVAAAAEMAKIIRAVDACR